MPGSFAPHCQDSRTHLLDRVIITHINSRQCKMEIGNVTVCLYESFLCAKMNAWMSFNVIFPHVAVHRG